MQRFSKIMIGALAVCCCGLFYAAVTAGSLAAQVDTNAEADERYQISAWSHAASPGKNSMSGAYVIDTQTGKIWMVINDNAPQELGTVK
ncbi:MAG: hypothetical protein R3C53_19450 [Pirellulaceae bacterium]